MSKVENLLTVIEKARRAENYTRMEVGVIELNEVLGTNDSPDALTARSKVTYELHMAAYQQAMALLQKSLDLAEQSATEARKAGDAVGALFTQMNASGLLLPALGKRKESFELSQEVHAEAQSLVATATDDKTKGRANRVAVNALFHQIRMLMEDDDNPAEVKRLLGLVEANTLYQSLKGKPEGWGSVEEIKAYIA